MAEEKITLIYVQDYLLDGQINQYVSEEMNIPLGVLYLGSYLKRNNFKARILDTRLYTQNNFFKILSKELEDTLVVGLSVMTPCVKNALEITKFIKSFDDKIKTVWGGVHPTLYPESTIRNKYIDFVITYEGEFALFFLIRYLLKDLNNIDFIPNLVFIKDNQIFKNEQRLIDNLEEVGIPDYSLMEIEKYINRFIKPDIFRRQVELITSRGCPHHCAFCINSINKVSYRYEPLSQTLLNLDNVIYKYNVNHIFFMDEDFFCNRHRMEPLIEELRKRKITWESNCRADYINSNYIDNEFLERLKESGCVKLRFGLESGSQRVLDLLEKGITVDQSIKVIKTLKPHRIIPSVSFMMGIPEEKPSDVIKTLKLILKLYSINPDIDIIGPLIFRPYPGSKLFLKCQEKGLTLPEELDEWSDFYIHNFLEEYKNGLIWFPYEWIFKRVFICIGYLRMGIKFRFLRPLFIFIIKLHLLTKLRFIQFDYRFYKSIKRLFGWILRKKKC